MKLATMQFTQKLKRGPNKTRSRKNEPNNIYSAKIKLSHDKTFLGI